MTNEQLPLEQAIDTFLREQVVTGKVGNQMEFGIDVSDPHREDLRAIQFGDFKLRNVVQTPSSSGDTFHCYVGRTEIHFMGQAAAAIRSILERRVQSGEQ